MKRKIFIMDNEYENEGGLLATLNLFGSNGDGESTPEDEGGGTGTGTGEGSGGTWD